MYTHGFGLTHRIFKVYVLLLLLFNPLIFISFNLSQLLTLLLTNYYKYRQTRKGSENARAASFQVRGVEGSGVGRRFCVHK